MLLKAGDPNAQDEREHSTPLHVAAQIGNPYG